MTDDTRHAVAKPGFLKTLPRKFERPMLLLNQTSIHPLSIEVALLRKAIKNVLKRVPDAAPRSAEPRQLAEEPSQIKPGKVSGATGQHVPHGKGEGVRSMKTNGQLEPTKLTKQ